ncbi:MAG: diguanylate cyclase [Lachnospiraceae bacterium]|nr:diguanylate cyclase [Lachnospiraceae bacterium]
MRSIQTKIIAAAAAFIAVAVLAVLGVAVFDLQKMQEHDSRQILTHMGNENVLRINHTLGGIEKGVDSVFYYIYSTLHGEEDIFKNGPEYDVFMEDMREMVQSVAENTDGVMMAYLRFDPKYNLRDPGFLLMKNKSSGGFEEIPLTDITLYSPEDVNHVGWYYLPINEGKAIWMEPYRNENVDVDMITYVRPVFLKDQPIGVIGMDVDIKMLQEAAAEVKVYDTGYAFIYDRDNNLVYHPDFPEGEKLDHLPTRYTIFLKNMESARDTGSIFKYEWDGKRKEMYASRLTNGMTFGIGVPEEEIAAPMHSLIGKTLIVVFIILALSALVLFFIVRTIVKPLRDITAATVELANGNLDVDLSYESDDEVGVLAQSFRTTTQSLKRYFEHFHGLAYTDELTKLNNKTAYGERIEMLNGEMHMGRARFAVVVVDINDLKKINDSFGHDRGDILIQGVAGVLKDVFGQASCYRIGGDEFAIIITTHEVGDIQKLIDTFEKRMLAFADTNEEIFGVKVSAAIGYSPYIRSSDNEYSQVFRRADTAMYGNKHEKKGTKHTHVARM